MIVGTSLLNTVNMTDIYSRKQLLLSARLSHRNSVRLSVTRVDQSKTVQGRITKSSPSAARKALVSRTVKLFHKFEGGHRDAFPVVPVCTLSALIASSSHPMAHSTTAPSQLPTVADPAGEQVQFSTIFNNFHFI